MAYYDLKQKQIVLEHEDKEFLGEQNQQMISKRFKWSSSIMKSILGEELYKSIKDNI